MKRFIGFALSPPQSVLQPSPKPVAGASSKQDFVRPKVELPAPAASPNLPFEVLKPVY